jgi:hypothetical protein
MCGDRLLFTSLKRFAEPQSVKLSDGSRILAYGKGLVVLESGTGHIRLMETWYFPEIGEIRLISILSMNIASSLIVTTAY